MNTLVKRSSFVLWAGTAADLMTPNPVSIPGNSTIKEAAAVLTDREIGALPVIDEAGRPIGVLTSSDIVRHERCQAMYSSQHEAASTDCSRVVDIMTPTILAVPDDAPTERVLIDFQAFKVHHLFVVDADGAMVGVISVSDIVRHLERLKL